MKSIVEQISRFLNSVMKLSTETDKVIYNL